MIPIDLVCTIVGMSTPLVFPGSIQCPKQGILFRNRNTFFREQTIRAAELHGAALRAARRVHNVVRDRSSDVGALCAGCRVELSVAGRRIACCRTCGVRDCAKCAEATQSYRWLPARHALLPGETGEVIRVGLSGDIADVRGPRGLSRMYSNVSRPE